MSGATFFDQADDFPDEKWEEFVAIGRSRRSVKPIQAISATPSRDWLAPGREGELVGYPQPHRLAERGQ